MSNFTAHSHRLLTLFITVVLVLASNACSSSETNNSTPILSSPPSTSLPLPPIRTDSGDSDLGWTLADGTRVKLSDHRGKVLVLDLYATWCEACRESIPHLIDLHQRYQSRNVQVVGLNVGGPDDRVKVPAFAADMKINYPLGSPDKPLGDLLLAGDNSIPQTFIFARDGKLLKRFIGYDDPMPAEIEQIIKTELGSE